MTVTCFDYLRGIKSHKEGLWMSLYLCKSANPHKDIFLSFVSNLGEGKLVKKKKTDPFFVSKRNEKSKLKLLLGHLHQAPLSFRVF